MSHQDIRIGTLAQAAKGADYLKQILPHGFESFQLTFWQTLNDVDLERNAAEVCEAIEGKAIISSLGMFGNPLENDATLQAWEACIDHAHLYGCDVVAGFSGALDGQSIEDSMPRYTEVWSALAKRAEDKGVRIAWENCDMNGNWGNLRINMAHAPHAWEMMFNAVPSDALGLCWEPCHQMKSLIDPIPQLRKWVGKVYNVHGKDGTIAWDIVKTRGIRGDEPYMWHRTPGFGDTNWSDIITILRMNDYKGSIDIEGWHDPVYRDELEMTGQVFGLNYLKQCRGGDFIPNPIDR